MNDDDHHHSPGDEQGATDPCKRVHPGREGGAIGPSGRWLSASERHVLGQTLGERLMCLWTVLNGAGCDFDDCWVATAEALGLQVDPTWHLPELLGAAGDVIDGADWGTLRVIGTDVFFSLRGDAPPYPHDKWDRRHFEEAVDDALFATAGCRMCERWPQVPLAEHREFARAVASGRLGWARIDSRLAKLAAEG